MSRFRFRLEPVLEHRARREELLQGELAQALGALAVQQEIAVDAERAIEAELSALRELQLGAIALHELREAHDGLERARRIAAHELRQVAALEAVAEERRAELVSASQAVEALVKLKRRDATEHAADAEHRDSVEMDELASRRHRNRSPVGGAAA